MLPIDNPKDKRTFQVITHYVKAGGKVKGIKNMEEFCRRYEIDVDKFEESITVEDAELLMFRLEKAGLL